jgi:hypothetical protein
MARLSASVSSAVRFNVRRALAVTGSRSVREATCFQRREHFPEAGTDVGARIAGFIFQVEDV